MKKNMKKDQEMESERVIAEPGIMRDIQVIEMALAFHTGCVVNDAVVDELPKGSWRIDHKKELEAIKRIKAHVLRNGICPLCGSDNTLPLDCH